MAGESAQQRYEKLRANRKAVDRRVLPWVLGVALVLAGASYVAIERHVPGVGWAGPLVILSFVIPFLGPSRTEAAWRRGAEGERIVGRALDALEPRGVRSLHDRRMPRSRANLDHISVAAGRVYTVDAKRYTGAIAVRRGALIIKGRDRSKLLDQARRQRDAVGAALASAGYGHVPVLPVLCFSGVEWPLLFPPRRAGDVQLCSPRGLRRTITADGAAGVAPTVDELLAVVDRAFPPVLTSAPPGAPVAPKDPVAPSVLPREVPGAAPPASGPAPSCGCGAAMVRRTRRSDGQLFYGCSSYPTCRRTRPLT